LEEQLAASRHEAKEAHLREALLMEDHQRAVISMIRQGVGVTLAAAWLHSGHDLRHLAPGFPDHARPKERMELVRDFTAAADAVVVAVNVEDILRGATTRCCDASSCSSCPFPAERGP
jgi:hypothetical protein